MPFLVAQFGMTRVRTLILCGALAALPTFASAQAGGAKPPVAKVPTKAPAKGPAKLPAKPSADTGQKVAEPASAAPIAAVVGTVFDSVHVRPLAGASVMMEGSPRIGHTDERGQFRIDSIAPGTYRVRVLHALLDSLGLSMLTNPLELKGGDEQEVALAIPSGATLVALSCPAARRALGPSAIIGRVLDADTDNPVDSARVSFAWSELSLQSLRRVPKLREAITSADGVYRICGLPPQIEGGTLQAIKNGVNTAEVRVSVEGEGLVIQGLRIGNTETVTRAPTDSAEKRVREAATGPLFSAMTMQRGNAALTGKVLSANGTPVIGARVDVVGTPGATLTRDGGEFSLSGLPSGTQSLVVRQIGFEPVEMPVELSTKAAARVTVTMTKPARILDPVVITASAAEGLERVGFNQRKRSAGGTFITGDDVMKRAPNLLSDVFRGVPGIRVEPVGNEYQIVSARNVMGGCVKYFVDGAPWEAMFPGDVDRLYPPQEIAGIEVYPSGSSVPAQFQQAGQSSCSAIVIWSRTRTERSSFKKKK